MISSTHKEGNISIKENSFLKELSAIFPNAKDWDGGRSNRKNKNDLKDNAEDEEEIEYLEE